MLNKVMLIGRLGKDPELRYSQSGAPIASLRVATDESYTDKDGNRVERTEWHSVSVFQRMAENCAAYLGKGSLVFVEGSLQTRKWQDQQGQDRYTTEIKAQRIQFLDRKGAHEGQEAGAASGAPRPRPPQSRPQNQNRPAPQNDYPDDLGPAFPSEASGMDEVPF